MLSSNRGRKSLDSNYVLLDLAIILIILMVGLEGEVSVEMIMGRTGQCNINCDKNPTWTGLGEEVKVSHV